LCMHACLRARLQPAVAGRLPAPASWKSMTAHHSAPMAKAAARAWDRVPLGSSSLVGVAPMHARPTGAPAPPMHRIRPALFSQATCHAVPAGLLVPCGGVAAAPTCYFARCAGRVPAGQLCGAVQQGAAWRAADGGGHARAQGCVPQAAAAAVAWMCVGPFACLVPRAHWHLPTSRPRCCPVTAPLSLRNAGYAEARKLEVLQPHDSAVAPLCEHFGPCGGCTLQSLAYGAQLREKQNQVSTHRHMYTHTHAHTTHAHTHTRTHTHNTHTHARRCTQTHAHTHVRTHARKHTVMCAQAHTCMHARAYKQSYCPRCLPYHWHVPIPPVIHLHALIRTPMNHANGR